MEDMTGIVEKKWNKGYPKNKGFYDCLVDGEVIRMYHFICVMNGKHKWYVSRSEEYHGDVLWKEPQEK